jgi:hypothetical protein
VEKLSAAIVVSLHDDVKTLNRHSAYLCIYEFFRT